MRQPTSQMCAWAKAFAWLTEKNVFLVFNNSISRCVTLQRCILRNVPNFIEHAHRRNEREWKSGRYSFVALQSRPFTRLARRLSGSHLFNDLMKFNLCTQTKGCHRVFFNVCNSVNSHHKSNSIDDTTNALNCEFFITSVRCVFFWKARENPFNSNEKLIY